jgi:hypothetical protein
MRAKVFLIGIAALGLAGTSALAEYASYGRLELTGLARDVDWPVNPSGPGNAMVCNVSGPDGYLSIRSGPGTNQSINRNLRRLAVVEVDTSQRRGHWIRVNTAYRTYTVNGQPQGFKRLDVTGWAHDSYLCAFLD